MDTTQNLTPDEQDDVEAHGLKEVAVGISAAAVLGGAGAGAALAAHSSPTPASKIAHAVQHTENQAVNALGHKSPTPPMTSAQNSHRTPAPSPLSKKLPKVHINTPTPPTSNGAMGQGLAPTVKKVEKTVKKTTGTVTDAVTNVTSKSHPMPPPQR
jgi:hypothetical protein